MSLVGLATFIGCDDDATTSSNVGPTIVSPLADLNLIEGFGSRTINFSNVFNDVDGDNLTVTASSSTTSVITVAISGNTLTITEQGIGSSIITLTASDGSEEVSDQFTINVMEGSNSAPTVTNALADLSLDEGFSTETVNFSNVFNDADGDNLSYTAESSNTAVITVSISGTMLTITEQANGTAAITLTANDGSSSVNDVFTVTVSATACTNDNSTNQDNRNCTRPAETSSYTESIGGGTRTIVTTGVPNHTYAIQMGSLNTDTKTYTMDATPSKRSTTTSIINNQFRPAYAVGVALNGVKIDPAPAEPFIFEVSTTGEYNWEWTFEPNNNMDVVGLDCSIAHLQPDGTYHYHGNMAPYADVLLAGLGTGSTVPTEVVQIGWAADGYPILYKYGKDASGNIKEMMPSYQLKSGNRPGDGVTEPCGEYNGKYTNDYEYVSGLGDLDECNGISQSITINGETFDYYYVITDNFPIIPRCFVGTPDQSFKVGG
ncbi:MAG: YHYH protein [Flammeovirgaceae bacterium]